MTESGRVRVAPLVKICGVTNVEDAEMCVRQGVDAIGLNFVPTSPRKIEVGVAKAISEAVRHRVPVIGVVANLSIDAMRALLDDALLDQLQLHGEESPDTLAEFFPRAYKGVRIANADDVVVARTYGGDDLLLDAKSPRALGGTGEIFDWSLVVEIAKERPITLAGGLTSENVTAAIRAVSPYRVDVASGVEIAGNPRKKDVSRVHAFLAAVRGSVP